MKSISATSRKRRAGAILKILKKLLPDAGMILNFGNEWELVVAVQLSAQCTDKMVNRVTAGLFKKYRTLDDYARARPREFERDIRSTGFYKNKTRNILAAAHYIKEHHGGRVPRTMHEMLAIPGVGRKTANVVLGNAHQIYEGIAVDTHVKRLSRLFGLSAHSDPNKIERDLMELIPPRDWFRFTYLLIEYGRQYCTARCTHAACPLRKYIAK